MSMDVLKVSSNGQVSIPAAVRKRWRTTRVLVIDKGDRVIVKPVPDDPLLTVVGKYADSVPPTDELRRLARAEDAEAEARRGGGPT